jgi:hypothetical protein
VLPVKRKNASGDFYFEDSRYDNTIPHNKTSQVKQTTRISVVLEVKMFNTSTPGRVLKLATLVSKIFSI